MASAGEQHTVWTVGRLLEWTTQWFAERDVEGGRLAAELLLARAMNCQKIELYTRYETVPSEEQRSAFREWVRQAGEHTPIAYLLGRREFFSLDFEVTPAVLIPRPETEALVQCVLDCCRAEPDRDWRVLDVGTGSGCIAVSIARYAANARVVATDISRDALVVAARNVESHEVADCVRLVEADGVALAADAIPAGGFDIVVSNPPYISEESFQGLMPEVRDHEPRAALVPPDGDGLNMYHRFAEEVPAVLKPSGRLFVEIGYDQHEDVRLIFEHADGWRYVGSHRDPNDPHERVVECERI